MARVNRLTPKSIGRNLADSIFLRAATDTCELATATMVDRCHVVVVDGRNFAEVAPKLCAAAERCTFFAIDTEFSGLSRSLRQRFVGAWSCVPLVLTVQHTAGGIVQGHPTKVLSLPRTRGLALIAGAWLRVFHAYRSRRQRCWRPQHQATLQRRAVRLPAASPGRPLHAHCAPASPPAPTPNPSASSVNGVLCGCRATSPSRQQPCSSSPSRGSMCSVCSPMGCRTVVPLNDAAVRKTPRGRRSVQPGTDGRLSAPLLMAAATVTAVRPRVQTHATVMWLSP